MKAAVLVGVLLLTIAIALGPALGVAGIVWLACFGRARLTARSAAAIFAVAALSSIGLDSHTIMPAVLFLLFPNERLCWMAATGGVVTIVVGLVSRYVTPE